MAEGFNLPLASSNTGNSILGGVKTGEGWARAKQLMDYRQAQLQRQQQQLKQQQANHDQAVLQKSLGGLRSVLIAPDDSKQGLFKIWLAQNQPLFPGKDLSQFKHLLNDPDIANVNAAKVITNVMQATKNGNPEQIGQAMNQVNAAFADPIMFRSMMVQMQRGLQQQNTQQTKADLTGKKDAVKSGLDYQKMLASDPTNKEADKKLAAVGQMEDQIELAKKNPIAYNTLPLELARTIVSQRLNIPEIKAAGGSQAFLARASQESKKLAEGTITSANYGFMKSMVQSLKSNAQVAKFHAESDIAGKYSQNAGLPLNEAYTKVTGGKSYDDQSKELGKFALTQLGDAKVARISAGIEKARKEGLNDSQILEHLQSSGAKLNPLQMKALGLSSATPATAPSAPLQTPAPMDNSNPEMITGPEDNEPAPAPEAPPMPEMAEPDFSGGEGEP